MASSNLSKIDMTRDKEAGSKRKSTANTSPFTLIKFANKLKMRGKVGRKSSGNVLAFKDIKKQNSRGSYNKLFTIASRTECDEELNEDLKSDPEMPEVLNKAEAVSPKRNKSIEPYSMIAKNKKVNKYDINAMNKLKTAIQSKHSKIIKENESMESCSLSLVTSEFEDEDSMSTKKVRKKTYKPRDFGKNKYTVIQKGNKIKKTSSILMTVLPQDKTYHPFESLSRNYNPEAQTVSVTKMKRMKHKLTKYFKKRLRSQEKPEKSEQISSKIKLIKSKKGFRRRSIEPNIQSKIKKSLHYLPKTPYSAFLRNNKASLPEIHSLFTAKEQEVIRSNKKVSRYMRKFFGQGSSSKPKLAERKPQKETSEIRTDDKFLATSSLAKQKITSDL